MFQFLRNMLVRAPRRDVEGALLDLTFCVMKVTSYDPVTKIAQLDGGDITATVKVEKRLTVGDSVDLSINDTGLGIIVNAPDPYVKPSADSYQR